MYDLVIRAGTLVDPRTKTGHRCDIALSGGFIAALGQDLPARQVIDARDRLVTPGFIDPHCHNDGITTYKDTQRCALQSLAQGVTTMLNGCCGGSVQQVGEYLQHYRGAVNVGEAIGSSALRRMFGHSDRYTPVAEDTLAKMLAHAEQSLRQGAWGITFGLGYVPGITMEEAMALCRVAARWGRVVSIDTNMRTPTDLDSLQQAIDLAEGSGARVQVSHFVYQYGEGVMTEALQMMQAARSRGVDIGADSGMYVWWATGAGAEMFREEFLQQNEYVLQQLVVATGEHAGKVLDLDLYRHMRAVHGDETLICKSGDMNSIYEALRAPYMIPCSDTAPYPVGQGHPQIAGSFARFLRKVREMDLMPMEEAIYRATLLPAETYHIQKRGTLDIGAHADLVVLDWPRVCDNARFSDEGAPDAPPDGIDYVLVNGRVAVDHGKACCMDAGQAIVFGT